MDALDLSGQIDYEGRPTPYLIRRLPIASFPEIPAPLALALAGRGCLIPQTYEAHRPENVVRASLAGPGTSDWALLCSAGGRVSLLVAFDGSADHIVTLLSFPETSRLQMHAVTGRLGFDWGIDPASPGQVRQAQAGLAPRPAATDHDALAEGIVDRRTVYHYFTGSAWTRLEMPE
jgi:hypothetical protein